MITWAVVGFIMFLLVAYKTQDVKVIPWYKELIVILICGPIVWVIGFFGIISDIIVWFTKE